ncbi:amino acid ABC transporter permease [Metaclostridioides mangenotii]|uniref:amino acid ABC transporter permease n=1 Tax=Metaclostridioides mangenotii TaxID=1540 RepID=UPI002ED0E4AB
MSNINLDVIIKYIPLYIQSAKITIILGVLGILLALIVGLVCSFIRYYKVPVLDKVIGIYIEVSRNTPLLIQLFFMYYGLPKLGLKLPAEVCAITGLGFLGGSYIAEAFRSGLDAVGKSQLDAGESIGLTRFQLMRYVIFPQAMAISIPALGANIIFLLKETSLFSAVAIADLTFLAKDLIGIYYDTNEALFLLIISYLIILLPLSITLTFVERKLRYAGYGL